MGDKEKKVLYHYTNEQGAAAIKQSQEIRGSRSSGKNDDARFGDGAYFTSLNPTEHSKKEIRQNNYDDGPSIHNSPRFKDKTDYVVAVSLPKENVEKAQNTKRDVWVHKGDVDLTEYDHLVLKNKK